MATKKQTQAFELPTEKVLVRYVMRQSGNIRNRNHVAYGGKLDGSIDTLPAKMVDGGNYADIFTEEEQLFLEKKLFLEEGDLSSYNKKGFLSKFKVTIGKEQTTLYLDKPTDFIKYKILESYAGLVSPDIFTTPTYKGYRYEFVREADVVSKQTTKLNYNRDAYKLFGKIEDSREQLAGAYRMVSHNKVSAESTLEWLRGQVGELIDKDAKGFVLTLKDEFYQTKLFIEQAIDAKVISRSKGLYYTADGMELSAEGEQPTLINAIKFLDNISNQDIKLQLTSKMK